MKKTLLAATTCLVLTACGGGGGGGGSDSASTPSSVGPAVALSEDNSLQATGEVMAAASDLQVTSDISERSLVGAQLESISTSPSMILQKQLPALVALLQQDTPLANSITGAITEKSVPCTYGGTMTLSGSDSNSNKRFDTGDTATATFNSCMLEADLKADGTMRMTMKSGAFSASTAYMVSVSTSLESFTTTAAGVKAISSGSLDLKIDQRSSTSGTVEMTTTPVMTTQTVQAGKTNVVHYRNYVVTAVANDDLGTWSVAGELNVPALGANTVTVKTITPFSFSTTYNPTLITAGQLTIKARDGGTLRVTATGTTDAKVELDAKSDGQYGAAKLIPWADIL